MTETINSTALPEGHPVSIYFQEKEIINSLLEEIKSFERFTKIHQHIQSITYN